MFGRTGLALTAGDGGIVLRAESRPGDEDERRVTARTGTGIEVGEIRFRVCDRCRTGRVRSLWVDEMWRREGIGLELVRAAVRSGTGFRWTTTVQSRRGRRFFAAAGLRLGVALPAAGPLCPHLTGRIEGLWRLRRPVC
ncbi:hypothetical protein [Streptomyces sp. NPDC050145]|uniref:hypothetical protein n=1 Tax=Streptomyces sp. NPDC050145 TaxID=3365602 RepID=UPI00379DA530